jgi:hypothetical protein
MMSDETPQVQGQCWDCRHFRNDAKFLETAFKGLTSLSSGYGSVRSDDGICVRHDRYLSARSSCQDFSLPSAHVDAGQI